MSFLSYLLCFFISSAFAQYKIYIQDNGTDTGNETDSGNRETDMTSLGIPGFISGLYYYSVDSPSTSNNASANGVFGAAYSISGPLVSYLAYFDIAADWSGANNSGSNADLSKAAAMIGSSYVSLKEVDQQNQTVLSSVMFKDLRWNVSQVETESNIKYATFYGTDTTQANFSISFTFVVSNGSETLSTGAHLSPKSVEAIINILNYKFVSNSSNLNLDVGVCTATIGSVSPIEEVDGYQRLSAGSGVGGVYWDGSNQVFVDANGTKQDVKINATAGDPSQMGGAGFVEQVQKMNLNITVNYTVVTITFPNSQNLTYDPSVGVDAFPNGTIRGTRDNSASAHSINFLSLFALISVISIIKA
jgi:hypothetical protein